MPITFAPKKGFRTFTFLRIAISGTSGSGKSCTSFMIATGLRDYLAEVDQLRGNGRILVIGAGEPKAAEKFCPVNEQDTRGPEDKIFDMDIEEIPPPYTPAKFVEYWQAAQEAGYPIVVTDGISQEWMGQGGLLTLHGEATERDKKKDSWGAWRVATPIHNAFLQGLVKSEFHHIVTMRAIEKYIRKGDKIESVGVRPIQRKDVKYEFDGYGMMRDNGADHRLTFGKFRNLPAVEKREIVNPDMSLGHILAEWLTQATITTEVETTGLPADTVKRIQGMLKELEYGDDDITDMLMRKGVTSIGEFDTDTAARLEKMLKGQLRQHRLQKRAEIATEPEEAAPEVNEHVVTEDTNIGDALMARVSESLADKGHPGTSQSVAEEEAAEQQESEEQEELAAGPEEETEEIAEEEGEQPEHPPHRLAIYNEILPLRTVLGYTEDRAEGCWEAHVISCGGDPANPSATLLSDEQLETLRDEILALKKEYDEDPKTFDITTYEFKAVEPEPEPEPAPKKGGKGGKKK